MSPKPEAPRATHTQGPWTAAPTEHRYAIRCVFGDVPERVIARCSGDGCDGNAALIAAAPDLLAALRFLLIRFEQVLPPSARIGNDIDAIHRADKAIAKAEGGAA